MLEPVLEPEPDDVSYDPPEEFDCADEMVDEAPTKKNDRVGLKNNGSRRIIAHHPF